MSYRVAVVGATGVVGREIECGVLDGHGTDAPRTSPLGECIVVKGHAFYDFEAKYLADDDIRLESPADVGPDIGEHLRSLAARNVRAAVVSPAGFLIDHVEVLYDLEVEAAEIAKEIGLTIARAGTVGDHPLFLDMLADVVKTTMDRYAAGRPLELVGHS